MAAASAAMGVLAQPHQQWAADTAKADLKAFGWSYEESPLELSAGNLTCGYAHFCLQPQTLQHSPSLAGADRQVTSAMLREKLSYIERSVVEFRDGQVPGGFAHVRRLQKAASNFGYVDLMNSPDGLQAAVKSMPTKWMHTTQKDFKGKYAKHCEDPWHDLAMIKALEGLGYGYVCDLFGVFRDEHKTYVAWSFASEGDLFEWTSCQEAMPGAEREAIIQPLVQQLMHAVGWLHSLGVAHMDISLENILVMKTEDRLSIKLIDFAQSSLVRWCRLSDFGGSVNGKRSYVAPERYFCDDYDAFLVDAFAVGVSIFCMAMKTFPWQATKPNVCKYFTYSARFGLEKAFATLPFGGYEKRVVDMMSGELLKVIIGLMQVLPENRMSLCRTCSVWGLCEDPTCVWKTKWAAQTAM
eukprot:TRINITY_DN30643_c0_g1_i2.p1 TRINITY_DN30643_c0_g1~~TRINITY_DN30643_c0_g1_i2.p1  ORF type:complete len:449 (+),score=79.43 TRINITY_DN30643_c0_g1_i2:116-1348(+)